MSKTKKATMSTQKSTIFWKNLGVSTAKRSYTVKRYNPRADKTALRRLKVDQAAIDKVYSICVTFSDQLFFNKFSRFFKRDIETVQVWTKTKTPSTAFLKLFNIYHRNQPEIAKKKYLELATVFEYYKKGEGQIYKAKIKSKNTIKGFSTQNLRRRLTASSKNSKYVPKGDVQFGNDRIICLERNTDGKRTDKLIKLSSSYNTLTVSLSMDSKKEYYIVKNELEKYFNTFLDTPETKAEFKEFYSFLRKGESEHFLLTGCTYRDNEFRITIIPSSNRKENVALLGTYKDTVAPDRKKMELLTQIRLTYKSKGQAKPVFISILTYREGIYGAILLHPDDKRLTASQRRKLYNDFKEDFNFPLNEFLQYDDLSTETIYKLFLETIPSKVSKVELRSAEALSIYTTLIKDKLINPDDITKEISKNCPNSDCRFCFTPVWDDRTHCVACDSPLINGKTMEFRNINESNIAEFLKAKMKLIGATVSNSTKSILSRKIIISQVAYGDEVVDFISVTKPFTDNQLMVLKFRYPYSILITTRQDADKLCEKGYNAMSLWEIAYDIYRTDSNVISAYAKNARERSLTIMRNIADASIRRLSDKPFYKERNSEVKNLGAELFEADCSILFDYIFGNCLWLGARNRGVSLPDGFTAFPMLDTNKGCFIWDAKFSEGKKLAMGNFPKNKRYIDDAKINQSIKDNGGLKGFVFVSNNTFPASFAKKYLALTKGKRLKVSFIKSDQLQKIARHYKQYERHILNNSKARTHFTNFMIDIFFDFTKNRKCEIISDGTIDANIKANRAYFSTLRAGKPLKA